MSANSPLRQKHPDLNESSSLSSTEGPIFEPNDLSSDLIFSILSGQIYLIFLKYSIPQAWRPPSQEPAEQTGLFSQVSGR